MAEAHAHLFFYSHISANPQSAIRIPELYHAWLPDNSASAYLVMEYINVHRFASDEERAKALAELIAVKPPPGVFGSFGPPGGYIRHMFFKDREAAKLYTSVQQLQDSINCLGFLHSTRWFTMRRSILILVPVECILPIEGCMSIANYNSMASSNSQLWEWSGLWHGWFQRRAIITLLRRYLPRELPCGRVWEESGNLWVIDFDITGVLPASFASWPLDTKYKHPLPIPIRRTIPLGTSRNLKPMFRVYSFNQISIG